VPITIMDKVADCFAAVDYCSQTNLDCSKTKTIHRVVSMSYLEFEQVSY